MTIDLTRTLGEIATEVPGATRVLEKLGLDYCCGGGRTLEAACAKKGLDAGEVQRALEQEASRGTEPAVDWTGRSLQALVQHILDTHHVYTREQLGHVERLLDKVYDVHGQNHPELLTLRRQFRELQADLEQHLLKEEEILFPYVAGLHLAAEAGACFGSVGQPIRVMEMEHETVGEILRQMRETTGDYAPPEDACRSFRALYQGLADLEKDLHQHIHLENNVLFPRAVAAEAARS